MKALFLDTPFCRECGAPKDSRLKCLMAFNDVHSWDRDAKDVERVAVALSMHEGRTNAPQETHTPGDFYEYLNDEEQEEWRVVARIAINSYKQSA